MLLKLIFPVAITGEEDEEELFLFKFRAKPVQVVGEADTWSAMNASLVVSRATELLAPAMPSLDELNNAKDGSS